MYFAGGNLSHLGTYYSISNGSTLKIRKKPWITEPESFDYWTTINPLDPITIILII